MKKYAFSSSMRTNTECLGFLLLVKINFEAETNEGNYDEMKGILCLISSSFLQMLSFGGLIKENVI